MSLTVLTGFVFFVLGASVSASGAQSAGGTLRGETTAVGPDGTTFSLSGVQLILTGESPGAPSLRAFADDVGKYQFVDLPPGAYTLEATLPGFKTVLKKITLAPGQSLVENIRLGLEVVRQEIEVRGQAPQVSQQSAAPPAKLSEPELLSSPVAEQKFKETMPFLAGVLRTQNQKIYIKGQAENQGILLLDSAETVDPVTGSFSIDIPIDAIQSLEVHRTPFGAEHGGFSGGMTTIQTKPPSLQWKFLMRDFNPSIRGKQGHWVGFARAEPRVYFSGPLGNKKLSFSEAFMYELRKENVRGLAWPNDETKTQGFNSFTSFQYVFSQHHLATVSVHVFPLRQQFANIRALVPRSASSDRGQRGFTLAVSDNYQISSGGVFTTRFKYTRFETNAHGQGPADMLLTPDGWLGDFFNTWKRTSNQEEASETFRFPVRQLLGKHEVTVGVNFVHRDFRGFSRSRPVRLVREDGSLAGRIDFVGQGSLSADDYRGSAFGQDHWALNDQLAFDLGLSYTGQSNGEGADFAPRLGVVFSPDRNGKTVFRGGFGIFYDRLPLLAGDFEGNLARRVSVFDEQGALRGSPLTFRNVCAITSQDGPRILASCSDFGSTPYNLTWKAEVDHHLTRNVTVRLGYSNSRTYNTFVIDPVQRPGSEPMLLLSNRGATRYHEYEATVEFHPGERSALALSYIHSRSRGDLNTVNEIFAPFEQPVIRPNLYGNLPSDVPDRLTGRGLFRLPWKLTFSPAVDFHSGFPYSNVDVFQNYVGAPNSRRFPTFFSLNWSVYRDFPIPILHKGHKFRLGVYSTNTTGRKNPTDVFNNVASPSFGQFTGFGKRINGIVIGFAN